MSVDILGKYRLNGSHVLSSKSGSLCQNYLFSILRILASFGRCETDLD